jgi:hypothetical protein
MYVALCSGLKNLPSANDLITRKSLIPNEMLLQVSVRDGARAHPRLQRRMHATSRDASNHAG